MPYVHQVCERITAQPYILSKIIAVCLHWFFCLFLLSVTCCGSSDTRWGFLLLESFDAAVDLNLVILMTLGKELCVFNVCLFTTGKFYMVFPTWNFSKVTSERLRVNELLVHKKSTMTEHPLEDALFVDQRCVDHEFWFMLAHFYPLKSGKSSS